MGRTDSICPGIVLGLSHIRLLTTQMEAQAVLGDLLTECHPLQTIYYVYSDTQDKSNLSPLWAYNRPHCRRGNTSYVESPCGGISRVLVKGHCQSSIPPKLAWPTDWPAPIICIGCWPISVASVWTGHKDILFINLTSH
jgi:hypothetical protein